MSKPEIQLGAFSISLSVKDLSASRSFYEKLGFEVIGGQADQNWLILRNGTTTIGLFCGMLESNMLTFNPGWDQQGNEVAGYSDIRDLQKDLETAGLEFLSKAQPGKGPGSFMLIDPDGNPILVDQHVG